MITKIAPGFCPHCEEEMPIVEISRYEIIDCRGIMTWVRTVFSRCLVCDKEFGVAGQYDCLPLVFDLYKAVTGKDVRGKSV